MTATLNAKLGAGGSELDIAAAPLILGGPGASLSLAGLAPGERAAAIAAADGRPFLQPLGTATAVLLNGHRVAGSHWLSDGDRLQVGPASLDVSLSDGLLVLAPAGDDPHALQLQPPARDQPPLAPSRRPAPRRLATPLVVAALALLLAAAWFVFTARMLRVEIEPVPEQISLRGGLAIRLADGFLARPGEYRLEARRAGYRPLSEPVVVDGAPPPLRLALRPLPGRVSIHSRPVSGAEVLVDGTPLGRTPLEDLALEAGEHRLLLRADRYLPLGRTITVEGRGRAQTVIAELQPGWAAVTVSADSPGAVLTVDGEPLGALPATVDLDAGRRRLTVTAPARKPWQGEIEVVAGEPLALGPLTLEPADGRLELASDPPGASVTVDGAYLGQTPLEVDLPSGGEHLITVSRAGHRTVTKRLTLDPEERRALRLRLAAERGRVRLGVEPPDATLVADGRDLGRADGVHELPALPQLLEIRHPGYRPERRWVTPRPGLEQSLQVRLQGLETPSAIAVPARIEAPDGSVMHLLRPGPLTLGASRREPGRRANESLREVVLERPYYLAEREVTNGQYRRFRPRHRSGRFQGLDLDDDRLPAVNLTWRDAAAYCDWLNVEAGLPPVYRSEGERLVADRPLGDGYRLPTEAEWAWAARHAGGGAPAPYPWGASLPPPAGAANLADRSVAHILADTLQGYDDGHAATAPPGAFAPHASGLLDLAGNVAEWVHDPYAIYPEGSRAPGTDPSGPPEGRLHVIRGSSWMHASVSALRWTYRDYGSEPRPDVGFRCARYAGAGS